MKEMFKWNEELFLMNVCQMKHETVEILSYQSLLDALILELFDGMVQFM